MNSLKQTKFYFLLFGYILLLPYRFPSPPIDSILPSVYVSPLKLHPAIRINLHGVSDSVLFRNHLKVRLSPLKVTCTKNSRSKYRRRVVYPSISTDSIRVLSLEEKDCGMQYVGQTCRFLKTRFSEHYRRINTEYWRCKYINGSTTSVK